MIRDFIVQRPARMIAPSCVQLSSGERKHACAKVSVENGSCTTVRWPLETVQFPAGEQYQLDTDPQ